MMVKMIMMMVAGGINDEIFYAYKLKLYDLITFKL